MKKLLHYQRAFTLIEVIVVISTLAFTLPIVTIILSMIIRQQIAVTRMTESKRQGDQAIAIIQEKLTRDVSSIYNVSGNKICQDSMSSPLDVDHFTDSMGNLIQFTVASNTLNLVTTTTTEPITDAQKVVVENNFSVQCIQNRAYTHPIVEVSFSIVPFGNFRSEELNTLRMHYSTKVIIRN